MILTATNERVQSYLLANKPPTTKAKETRLDLFKQLIQKKIGVFLSELFPRKQEQVLDEILYLTSGSGIAKIGADRLAERADVSARTISTVVNKLKKTDQFIVARINNGQAGKYIFVDKLHPNFKEIMNVVFNIDAYQLAYQFASLEKSETVDTTDSNGDILGSNHLSSIINTSFLNNKYNNNQLDNDAVQEIQKEIDNEPVMDLNEQQKMIEQYATNEYQKLYFKTMNMIPLHEEIMSSLYKMALRVGSDATNKHFHAAKTATLELNMQLHQRTTNIRESVISLFTTMYKNLLNQQLVPEAGETPIKIESNKIVFYNWLDEREFDVPKTNVSIPESKYFYNWLDER